jgi:quercetin dioxygenase-like cupin family protein
VTPTVVDHDEQPVAEWRAGVLTRLHMAASTGATGLCIGEQWFQPGTGAPLHTHPGVEETITVLEGAGDFTVDGETVRLRAGQTILLPADSVHGFRNAGAGILHVLGIYASASPPTVYLDRPETLVEIGGTDGDAIDATRTARPV